MGNRLSQIATRTGDTGTTGLGNNQRVSKNSLRVHAMGEVDELNSNIGVFLCEEMPQNVRDVMVEIQHQLFNLGGELSIPGFELLKDEAVQALDTALETYNAKLPKLEELEQQHPRYVVEGHRFQQEQSAPLCVQNLACLPPACQSW